MNAGAETLPSYPAAATVGIGAWNWFSDPRALKLQGSLVVGMTSGEPGSPIGVSCSEDYITFAERHDFSTGGKVDDHASPALLKRSSDGRVLAFYARHNGDALFIATSLNAEDATVWSPPVDLGRQLGVSPVSYANPVQLTGEMDAPIYLFHRGGRPPNGPAYVTKSLDQGVTWSASRALIQNGLHRPYLKAINNGDDRIDLLCTDGHPNEVPSNSVYHFYYQRGKYFKSDGSCIAGVPPFVPAESFSLIFDGSTSAGNAWIWDLRIDGSGNPHALFARFPSTHDHRYMHARFRAGVWAVNEVCPGGGPLCSGEPHYSGGLCFNPDDLRVVFACRRVGSVHELHKHMTADGVNWSDVQMTYDGVACFRPFVASGTDRVLFCRGTYKHYKNFDTEIRIMDAVHV